MTNEEFIKSISLEGEEWRDVVGFEGLYMLSSFGRVIGLNKRVNNGHKDVFKAAHILKYANNCKPKVLLSKNRKHVSFHIANEVAKHFLPQPPQGCCVLDFKDTNPFNVKADNLFWRKPKDRHVIFDTRNLEGEEWKAIEGYDYYMISNKGRVKTITHCQQFKNRIVNVQEHILVPFKTKRGYLAIRLGMGGKNQYVHRLVANAFIPNSDNKPCIDHINTIRDDNRVENLRWCTESENMQNPITTKKLSDILRGRVLNSTRLSPVVCLNGEILLGTYPSIASASKDGYCYSSIQKCLCGIQNSHKGLKWLYLSDYEASINKSKNT